MNDVEKQMIFTGFVSLRRIARMVIGWQQELADERRFARREKARLVALDNPFHASRIKALDQDLQDIAEESADDQATLADLGPHLLNLCWAAEPVLTFRDKAHILGVSETHLRKRMGKKPECTRLHSMIFVYHAEYRGHDDFIGPNRVEMPLWEIASAHFAHLLHNNKDFAKTVGEGFDCCFPGIPKYQQVTQPDGTTSIERMPPELRLIEGEAQV